MRGIASIPVLVLSAAPIAAEGNGIFEGPLVIGTFPRPIQGAAAGDFNRDGRLDVAAADGTDRIQVVLQGPGGRLEWRRQESPAGSAAFFLRALDLDSDGDDDLVVAAPGARAFSLRCRGDGTFEPPEALAGSEMARWIAFGDWDGDRKVDLATANYTVSTVSILGGDGRGGFTLSGTYPVGGNPHAMEALDYDGDGRIDLAVKLTATGIQLFRGRGDGTFDPLPVTDALGVHQNIATGDFNHDGKGDLAIECCGVGIGLGDGSFQKTLSFPGSGTTAISDLDGDGNQDVAHLFSGSLLAYLGVGDGTFLSPVSSGATGLDAILLAADLDGDGRQDLLSAEVLSSSLTVIWGREGDRFLETGIPLSGFGPAGPASAADLNRSGRPDLFLPSATLPRVQVFLDPGTSEATSPSLAIETARAFTFLAVADLDGDGVPDLAGANRAAGSGLVALLDASGKVRRQAELPAGLLPSAVAVGRLDGDGTPDLAVLCAGSMHVAVFLNGGDGFLGEARNAPTIEKPIGLAAGDLDGDGRQDLAVISSREAAVHHGKGEGLFSARTSIWSDPLGSFVDLEAADLDGDGVEDLAVLDAVRGKVLLFHGERGREPIAWSPLAVGAFPQSIAIGDLDGDDLLDLTTANADDQSVSVLRNRGGGAFADRQDFWIGFPRPSHLLADLDSDGALDLAVFKASAALVLPGRSGPAVPLRFLRGDADGDRSVQINDPIRVLERLFLGGEVLSCEDAADANDDGAVDLADPIAILSRLFLGGEPLPPPGTSDCGADPTADGLGCRQTLCEG